MGKIKSKLERKKEIQEHYQAWINLGFAGYIDQPEEALVKEVLVEVAKNFDFIPSYFAAVALLEGVGWGYLDYQSNFTTGTPKKVRNDIPVNGYQVIGTDDFGSEFGRYQKYLGKDFNQGNSEADFKTGAEFYAFNRKNEKKEEVTTAVFKNIETAIWACGATLAHRRDAFHRHRKQLGIPSPINDQLAYWNYFYYNGGEGKGFMALKKYKRLNIFDRNTDYPNRKVTLKNRTTNDNALCLLACWRYLQTFNLFEQ